MKKLMNVKGWTINGTKPVSIKSSCMLSKISVNPLEKEMVLKRMMVVRDPQDEKMEEVMTVRDWKY